MDQQHLRELAEAGGLCDGCGGVHTPRIEHAILADHADPPLCDCEDCPICRPVREALMEDEDQ